MHKENAIRAFSDLEAFQVREGSALRIGWLVVLGLTALWDSISGYIRPPPREKEKEKR